MAALPSPSKSPVRPICPVLIGDRAQIACRRKDPRAVPSGRCILAGRCVAPQDAERRPPSDRRAREERREEL